MIDAAHLEEMIRDISDKRGFFRREARSYHVEENDMYLLCRDVADRLNIKSGRGTSA